MQLTSQLYEIKIKTSDLQFNYKISDVIKLAIYVKKIGM